MPGFISGRGLEELQEKVDRFLLEIAPGLPKERVFYEDKNDPSSLKQIQQLGNHDPWFRSLLLDSPLRALAEKLLGGPVLPKNLQYFCKPPQLGKATPPHQDGFYFMLDPCEAVTMWLALDEVDAENGCVRYVEGSHRQGIRKHCRTETLGFSQGIADYPSPEDRKSERAIPASPGDLLAHHALTIHRADANQSHSRTRRAIGFIYYSERAREDTVAHAAYQRKLVEEMQAAEKI